TDVEIVQVCSPGGPTEVDVLEDLNLRQPRRGRHLHLHPGTTAPLAPGSSPSRLIRPFRHGQALRIDERPGEPVQGDAWHQHDSFAHYCVTPFVLQRQLIGTATPRQRSVQPLSVIPSKCKRLVMSL